MKFISPLFIALLILAACAGRNYQDDKNDPNYQKGAMLPANRQGSVDMDNNGLENRSQNPSGISPGVGMAAAGISLAFNRDYYKKEAITGKVVCRSKPKDPIEFPCSNVEVALYNDKGKVTSIEPHNGEFAFRVPEKTPYRLRIRSKIYKMEPQETTQLFRGDDIILDLFTKN